MSNSYIQVPPDGAGKKVFTTSYTDSGGTYQVQGVNIVSGDDPTHGQNIDHRGSGYVRFFEGDPLISPYGDLKTVQEYIVGVYDHTSESYDDLYYIEEISGGMFQRN